MSKLDISFKAKLKVGDEVIPLASEIVAGDSQSQDGVENGFVFRLDLGPTDAPVVLNLGAIIELIENKLGAGSGSLQGNSGISTLQQIFPGQVDGSNFNSGNSTLVNLKAFEINSSSSKFLFQISVDISGSDPAQGFLPLPPALSSWLSIDNLAISFSATSQNSN